MFCPECGTPIKKGSYICANCKFKIKLTTEIVGKKDKKEKNDDKTKKIEKKKAKTNRKKKEVEVKTSMNDIDGMKPEEPKEDLNIDLKTKEKIDRNIVTQNDINKTSIKINEDVPFEIEKVIEKPVIRIDPEAEKSISINSILPEGPNKKEKNDDKTKKIEKKKAKTNRKKKEVEVKTSMNDIDGMKPEEPKEDLNIDLKTKEKIDRNIVTQNDINKTSIKINEDVPFEIEKVIEKPVIRIDPEAEKSISINSILPEGPNKKEKNDDKTKKIEKSKSPPVHKNENVKRNFIKKIGSLYNELIDNSFREKT